MMGSQYVQQGELVPLPREFVSEVNRNCHALRPAHRLGMEADENCRFAVAMPDFCRLPVPRSRSVTVDEPTFCVEIKPKCGFLPTSRWIKTEHAVRRDVCHYCMLQKLKEEEGKYRRQSKYCPVDLFSGVGVRVMRALESLVGDPQNNWRVFCDDSALYTEEICQEALKNCSACCYEMVFEKSLEKLFHASAEDAAAHVCGTIGTSGKAFLSIVLQILIIDSQENEVGKAKTKIAQICKARGGVTMENNLPPNSASGTFGQGGVLQHLLAIQQLDDMDVEGIFPLYQMVKKRFQASPGLVTELGVHGPFTSPIWADIVLQYQTKETTFPQSTIHDPMDALADDFVREMDGLKTVVQKICEFAIASTAKDCSIMITFQKSSHEHSFSISDISGTSYNYDINLVDLDPKGFDRVTKYHKDVDQVTSTYIH